VDAAINRVIGRGQFILGPEVLAFEKEFAAYCGAREAVGVGSGTDALTLALVGAGVQAGDEVITTSLSSVATATAIVRAGARPVLVDIDLDSFNLNPRLVQEHVTNRTRAILPVHLYGRPFSKALLDVSRSNGVALIEDACQAHGASLEGRRTGTLGLAGCFSFYPSKNLGAYGDAGMVLTNDSLFAERVRRARQYGWKERDRSDTLGYNSRLDEIQAAVLRSKLPCLDAWNGRRRQIARRYQEGLAGTPGIALPEITDGHTFHLYVVRVRNRNRLRAALAEHGIATGIHYPVPVHRQPAFQGLVNADDPFPSTDLAVSEILSLPIFPQLTDQEVDRVSEAVRLELRSAK